MPGWRRVADLDSLMSMVQLEAQNKQGYWRKAGEHSARKVTHN